MGDSGTLNVPATAVSLKTGILNLPGSTPTSKRKAEELLAKDLETHHCYFNSIGFHNHLSHHLFAAYDLGASAELLDAIYASEEKIQRPIMLDEAEGIIRPGTINENNWTQYVGNEKAFAAYIHFFRDQIKLLGPDDAVKKYIFSAEANVKNVEMLITLYSGVIHPFIQLGYAAEFGNDTTLLSEALSLTAMHKFSALNILDEEYTGDGYSDTGADAFQFIPSEKKLSLLEVFAEYSKSPILAPVLPYEPESYPNLIVRIKKAFDSKAGRAKEIARICSMWDIPNPLTPADLDRIVEEAIWISTLLYAGTSKPDRKPRLDFFLMHCLTSSLFIRPLCEKLVTNPESQVRLIRFWLVAVMITAVLRGRPQVNGEVLMGYSDKPLPPQYDKIMPKPDKSAILPDSASQAGVNNWGLIVQSALRSPDAHTLKSIRTLQYGAIHYGTRGPGEIPGSQNPELEKVIPGIRNIDGTIFLRAAGVTMNNQGWVDWGQEAGNWDRSALGWDDAWKNED